MPTLIPSLMAPNSPNQNVTLQPQDETTAFKPDSTWRYAVDQSVLAMLGGEGGEG